MSNETLAASIRRELTFFVITTNPETYLKQQGYARNVDAFKAI
jgi:hypothetical protein